MGASSVQLSPLFPSMSPHVPPLGVDAIRPYDPTSDPLAGLSPVLVGRRQRRSEAAKALADRRTALLRAVADLERRAAVARQRLSRARERATAVIRGIVVGPGYAAWDRYATRAASYEARAAAKRAEAAGLDRRAGEAALAVRALERQHRALADIRRQANASAAKIMVTAATRLAKPDTSEDKRVVTKLDRIRDRLTEHEQRSHPFDAETRMAVIIQRTKKQTAKVRLMTTASKFKGGKRGVMAMLAERAERERLEVESPIFGQLLVSPERVASIRSEVERERNRRRVPIRWDALDVDLWLIGAYETLMRLPTSVYPRQFGNAMPTPTNHAGVEWGDELARLSLDDDDDSAPMFGRARLRALGMPDKLDVDRMSIALSWASDFLAESDAIVARAVGYGAMWKAVDFPESIIRDNVDDVFGMHYFDFDRMRGGGLSVIAEGLNARNATRTIL